MRLQDATQEHLNTLSAMESGYNEYIYEITAQHMESPKKIINQQIF